MFGNVQANPGELSSEELKNAKSYQRIRNWLTLVDIVLTILLLCVMMGFGIQNFFLWLAGISNHLWLELFLFFLGFSLFFLVFHLPFRFYSGYLLEKRYQLSNHTPQSWVMETLKKEILSFVLTTALVFLLFLLVWKNPKDWWWWTWLAYAGVTILLGKLFPILIIPLFYKYDPLPEGELRARIVTLANRFGMNVKNIYSLNLSKTTKKANAAFLGLGKTKRIVLSDTLIQNFTNDEIETVLAHELGHFKHKDIWKQLALGMIMSWMAFWLVHRVLDSVAADFGYLGIKDLYYFPLLCLVFYSFSLIVSPLGNFFSRYVEKQADLFALRATRDQDAFISAMEKLSQMNLADPSPHPLIEFLLYDHPAIGKRIALAQKFAP